MHFLLVELFVWPAALVYLFFLFKFPNYLLTDGAAGNVLRVVEGVVGLADVVNRSGIAGRVAGFLIVVVVDGQDLSAEP